MQLREKFIILDHDAIVDELVEILSIFFEKNLNSFLLALI